MLRMVPATLLNTRYRARLGFRLSLAAHHRLASLSANNLIWLFQWYSFYTVFEYDPKKSDANKSKHGIDFFEAQNLWAGETVQVPARFSEEPRIAVFGMIGADYWTAIVTLPGENIRIISVRRSRQDEIEFYEKAKKDLS